MNDQVSVSEYLIVKGELKLESPLIIGGGETKGADTDIVVVKDEQGRPYIPGSSLTGSLRSYFYTKALWENSVNESEHKNIYFWGGSYFTKDCTKKQSDELICFNVKSAISISDALLIDPKVLILVRDGIKIDSTRGIVEKEAKFDYEIVEPGARFGFQMTVKKREFDSEFIISTIAFLIDALQTGEISLGAMSTKGFGRVKLDNWHFYRFNMSNKGHICAWLDPESADWPEEHLDTGRAFKKAEDGLKITANLLIKNSLIIGSYSNNPNAPDKAHIMSNGRHILPGTSLKGAIRGRAEKIVNTLGGSPEWLNDLFGVVDKKEKNRKKSRLRVEETEINNVVEEIQKRIRIDRFTGGTIKNALFDSMPLWADSTADNLSMVQIKLSLDKLTRSKDYESWEAGLLLLVLKDIWTGDLAIGGDKGIGRGVLQGLSAEIFLRKERFALDSKPNKRLTIQGDAGHLENCVNELVGKCAASGRENVDGKI